MPNILDYIDWRGDVSFDYAPLNEIDCYIICKLGCPNLTGVVPDAGEAVPVGELVRRYFAENSASDESLGVLAPQQLLPMLKKIPHTRRFGGLKVSDYVSRIDLAREEQFSAATVHLPDGSHFITFRGTDDTLVAWKENLNMSVEDAVPAQLDAVAYLLRTAERYPGPLYVCGHSKGGNLAVYSCMNAPEAVQERLVSIYNFDGPGFREPVFEDPAYLRIRPRLVTLVPQYAMVGMLLCHEEDVEIVESGESGIAAHNGFNWETTPTGFVRRDSFAMSSRLFESAVSGWAAQLDTRQRQEFIDALFEVLGSTGAETVSDLSVHKLRQSVGLVQTLRRDPETREALTGALELFLKEYVSTAKDALPKPRIPGAGRFWKNK